MSDRYILSPQADRKIDEFWDYYFQVGGVDLAERMVNDILDGIDRLAEFPHRGHPRHDLTDPPYLAYRVHSAMIFYDPTTAPIYVFRIYHVAQDIGRLLASGD